METKLKSSAKEVQYLTYMLNFKEIGLEKRDIMLTKYMEELTTLNNEMNNLKALNKRYKMDLD